MAMAQLRVVDPLGHADVQALHLPVVPPDGSRAHEAVRTANGARRVSGGGVWTYQRPSPLAVQRVAVAQFHGGQQRAQPRHIHVRLGSAQDQVRCPGGESSCAVLGLPARQSQRLGALVAVEAQEACCTLHQQFVGNDARVCGVCAPGRDRQELRHPFALGCACGEPLGIPRPAGKLIQRVAGDHHVGPRRVYPVGATIQLPGIEMHIQRARLAGLQRHIVDRLAPGRIAAGWLHLDHRRPSTRQQPAGERSGDAGGHLQYPHPGQRRPRGRASGISGERRGHWLTVPPSNPAWQCKLGVR